MLGNNSSNLQTVDVIGADSIAPRLRPLAIALVAFILAAAAWYVGQVIVLDHSAAAAVNSSVADANAPIRPDTTTTIQVTAQGAGVALEGAQLLRADIAADGSRSAEQPIGVRLEPTDDPTTWQVAALDGGPLLRTDGAYRLALHVAAPRPALPMPRTDTFERQYRFTTVASPRAQIPSGPLQPRWSEPVSLTWSQPMADVTATVQPTAPLRAWVDSRDPTRTWLQLGGEAGTGLTDGQTYDITIAEARSADGLSLQQPLGFKVAIPARPSFINLPTAPVTLRYGDSFTLQSSQNLATVEATTSAPDSTRLEIGQNEIRLSVPMYQQGSEFDLAVVSATSPLGAPLAQAVAVRFVTPPALDAPTFQPQDGSIGIQPSSHPSITFAQPLADPTAATQALSIDPPVAGHWQWSSADTAEFVPDGQLPILTDITLTVKGGPDGPRTAAGGYLEGDQSASFTTTDYKRIDVSLSRQTMTLYENNVAMKTIYVATGVAAAPTPPGTYFVQMKAPQMRFRGVNPDGSHYDIPDVHWVMPFNGDYTIHGAYWRPRFGVPGSDGCVSMSDSDAKAVYDWANVGTPVVIHS
jgi:hypothetical protein